MRFARKLTLLAMMAMAAMALAAPAAFGQETDLSATTSGGVPCGNVVLTDHAVTGGCVVHAVNDHPVTLRAHVFGIESTESTCHNEFDGRVDSNAEGYIYNQVLTDVVGNDCTREPCSENDASSQHGPTVSEPWRAHGHENPESTHADQGFTEGLSVTFCVAQKTEEMTRRPLCNVEVPFRQTGVNQYEFGEEGVEMAGTGPAGFRCELVGHWNTEGAGTETNVLLNHTD